MVRLDEIRRNEVAVRPPARRDVELMVIGYIETPWTSRLDCPRQGRLTVQGLDCLDGTPLLDLKPDRSLFTPLAPQPGDSQTAGERKWR